MQNIKVIACKAMLLLLPKAGAMADNEANVNFAAPAVLRKWPSVRNERRAEGTSPYLLVDGTLGECIGSSWPSRLPRVICTKSMRSPSRRRYLSSSLKGSSQSSGGCGGFRMHSLQPTGYLLG